MASEHPRGRGSGRERRREARQAVRLGAVLMAEGYPEAKGWALDLSSRGARISACPMLVGTDDWQPDPLDPEARVWLAVDYPGVPLPISLRARIVWRQGDAVGLAFVSPPDHTKTRLSSLLGEMSSQV